MANNAFQGRAAGCLTAILACLLFIIVYAVYMSDTVRWSAAAQEEARHPRTGQLKLNLNPELLDMNLKAVNKFLPFVNVVVVATSAAQWTERRERIRKQFPRNVKLIKDPLQSVVLKFAVGFQKMANHAYEAVAMEQQQHSDILWLDCLDLDEELTDAANWSLEAGPSATTSKVLLSIQWAVRNFEFEYFFRLGDDSYLRIDMFMSLLASRQLPFRNAVVGRINTAEVFGMMQSYASGAGYALTFDVCEFVASNTAALSRTAPEDCVVARWLFAIGANFVDSPLWREMGIPERCDPEMMLAHRLPAEAWSVIAEDGNVEC